MLINRYVASVATALFVMSTASFAGSTVLFDGRLRTTPDVQGWIYATQPLVNARVTQVCNQGIGDKPTDTVTLNTMAVLAERAGYFSEARPLGLRHPATTKLDRESGFAVRVEMQLHGEQHTRVHRAGFSVIVVSQDLRAIELQFWTDRVWVQEFDAADKTRQFVHAEEVEFDTTRRLTRYDIVIKNEHYKVLADGVEILTGPLRDYSTIQSPFRVFYATPSFIFWGDDTSGAGAEVSVRYVGVMYDDEMP